MAVRTVSGVSPRLVGSLLCALACVGVGSSISITAAMRDYPVHGGQALRYLATGLILLLVLRIRSVPWLRPTGRDLLRLLALAGSGMVGFNVVLIEATRYASPSLIGAMLGCAPLILTIAGPLLLRQRPRLGVISCAAVVVVGIAIIEGVGGGSPIGTVLAVGVLLGEVGFSLLAVPLLPRYGPLRVSCYASLISAAAFVVIGLIAPGPLLRIPTPTEAIALVIMGAVFTPGAFVAWYAGLQRLGPAAAGLWIGVMPPAATAASVLLGWEPLTPAGVIGSVLIAAGVSTGLRLNADSSAPAAGASRPETDESVSRDPVPGDPVLGDSVLGDSGSGDPGAVDRAATGVAATGPAITRTSRG